MSGYVCVVGVPAMSIFDGDFWASGSGHGLCVARRPGAASLPVDGRRATLRVHGYPAVFVRIPVGVAGYPVVMTAGYQRSQCLMALALLQSVTVMVGAAAIARTITVSRKVSESFGPIPSSNRGMSVLERFLTLKVCPQFCVR